MKSTSASLEITPLPAFSDNYLWLIISHPYALVVDPGDAAVVEQALMAKQLTLTGVLLTHHHADHVGGAAALQQRWQCPVYAPVSTHPSYLAMRVTPAPEGDVIVLPHFEDISCIVMALPGHTNDHIAYYLDHRFLFSGDVLFGAGCGRLFEGTPTEMYSSLQRIARLPAETTIFPAHEYTLQNLAFAQTVEHDNTALQDRVAESNRLRSQGLPTLPTSLAQELATNPFLRCDLFVKRPEFSGWSAIEIFTELRARRNQF